MPDTMIVDADLPGLDDPYAKLRAPGADALRGLRASGNGGDSLASRRTHQP